MSVMPYQLRDAVPDDAVVIARHRVRMFNEMGELSDADPDQPVRAILSAIALGWSSKWN